MIWGRKKQTYSEVKAAQLPGDQLCVLIRDAINAGVDVDIDRVDQLARDAGWTASDVDAYTKHIQERVKLKQAKAAGEAAEARIADINKIIEAEDAKLQAAQDARDAVVTPLSFERQRLFMVMQRGISSTHDLVQCSLPSLVARKAAIAEGRRVAAHEEQLALEAIRRQESLLREAEQQIEEGRQQGWAEERKEFAERVIKEKKAELAEVMARLKKLDDDEKEWERDAINW